MKWKIGTACSAPYRGLHVPLAASCAPALEAFLLSAFVPPQRKEFHNRTGRALQTCTLLAVCNDLFALRRKEFYIKTGQRHYYFMNVGNGEVIDACRKVGNEGQKQTGSKGCRL